MPQLTQLIGPTAGHTSCTSALPFPSPHNAEVPEAPPEPPRPGGAFFWNTMRPPGLVGVVGAPRAGKARYSCLLKPVQSAKRF
jgi:hypothetical protein